MIQTRSKVLDVSLVLALAASMLFSALPVSAQTSGGAGLSVSPPMSEITASPGEEFTRSFSLTNNGSESQIVDLVLNNFASANEDGAASYSPGLSGLASWADLSSDSLLLEAGASRNVSVTFNIPANAPAGGHYAALFAATRAKDNGGSGTSTAVTTAVGSNILVNVTGNIIKRSSVAEFSTPRARLNAGEDVNLAVRISNSGTTHVQPKGMVELYRKGVMVDEIPLNESGAVVLPNSVRRFEVSSDKTLLPGAYTAKLVVSSGDSSEQLDAPEISFAVIGDSSLLTVVAGGLAALVVLLALALLVGRKRGTVK